MAGPCTYLYFITLKRAKNLSKHKRFGLDTLLKCRKSDSSTSRNITQPFIKNQFFERHVALSIYKHLQYRGPYSRMLEA